MTKARINDAARLHFKLTLRNRAEEWLQAPGFLRFSESQERFQGSTQKQYAICIRKKEQLDQLGMDVKHRLLLGL